MEALCGMRVDRGQEIICGIIPYPQGCCQYSCLQRLAALRIFYEISAGLKDAVDRKRVAVFYEIAPHLRR